MFQHLDPANTGEAPVDLLLRGLQTSHTYTDEDEGGVSDNRKNTFNMGDLICMGLGEWTYNTLVSRLKSMCDKSYGKVCGSIEKNEPAVTWGEVMLSTNICNYCIMQL